MTQMVTPTYEEALERPMPSRVATARETISTIRLWETDGLRSIQEQKPIPIWDIWPPAASLK